ncbi:MAG TPA: DUF3343 domain-containing protein [Syntrophales bacterium]|nr:DUF3343 domain-containing protein [Syntrophales bacterium]HPQ43199.1 DUF3343 domain-containing protein [Syntrophales bacterium]
MTDPEPFCVILFDSTSEALLAEKLFKKADIPHKVIPVPRHLSSDCGVCIRFSARDTQRVKTALDGRVAVRSISPLD